ncbi:hypothetical protein BDN70DRAFT_67419 [Pholiota conissans]|uniref:Uncharacterized protein n=1 Tax=Pholiota conissans TaxID=109636 RepID=A0A9P5YZW0_9AGAR|nr:hypothetical protein BDN70DRAFT_67419 [Pholiota conissans]
MTSRARRLETRLLSNRPLSLLVLRMTTHTCHFCVCFSFIPSITQVPMLTRTTHHCHRPHRKHHATRPSRPPTRSSSFNPSVHPSIWSLRVAAVIPSVYTLVRPSTNANTFASASAQRSRSRPSTSASFICATKSTSRPSIPSPSLPPPPRLTHPSLRPSLQQSHRIASHIRTPNLHLGPPSLRHASYSSLPWAGITITRRCHRDTELTNIHVEDRSRTHCRRCGDIRFDSANRLHLVSFGAHIRHRRPRRRLRAVISGLALQRRPCVRVPSTRDRDSLSKFKKPLAHIISLTGCKLEARRASHFHRAPPLVCSIATFHAFSPSPCRSCHHTTYTAHAEWTMSSFRSTFYTYAPCAAKHFEASFSLQAQVRGMSSTGLEDPSAGYTGPMRVPPFFLALFSLIFPSSPSFHRPSSVH